VQLEFEFAKAVTTPPPDFSECLQFDPEERTAEAAAARKKISPLPLTSSFIADLNGYRVTQDILRHPSGPTVPELVKVGNLVETNYGTGPYVVKRISKHLDYGVETYTLACSSPTHSGESYLNELVAVDGRILDLFLASKDEVFLLGEMPVEPGHLF
jgi:hypothetical protein